MNPTKWNGTWPANCNSCLTDLRQHSTFYDAKTIYGHWALLCPRCFREIGLGLGLGRGQEYDSGTREKLAGS